MEDRYLFKAKRIDNGEWATGSLITCEDGTCKIATSCLEGKADEPILVCAYDVDRNTICQCTGLKDKNGKLIWENDIMVAHLDKDNPEDITYAIVAWRENGWVTIENGSDDLNQIDDFTTENFEVVSTRFDNPELLEVGE